MNRTGYLMIGNRVPCDFFITQGHGESDITIHAGSYHLALKKAGIEMCNLINYSSILPKTANKIKRPKNLVHGSVMETISAVSNSEKGQLATAGIIYGLLYNKKTGEKHGGLVCEYNGSLTKETAALQLEQSLNELYQNGHSAKYSLKDKTLITESFIPKKSYGTSIVAICFTTYLYPLIKGPLKSSDKGFILEKLV